MGEGVGAMGWVACAWAVVGVEVGMVEAQAVGAAAAAAARVVKEAVVLRAERGGMAFATARPRKKGHV